MSKTIIGLTSELKSGKSDVSISSIIMKVDKAKSNKKETNSTNIWKKYVKKYFFSYWSKQVMWIVVGFI